MTALKYTPYVRQNATRTTLDLPVRIHYPFVHMEQNMWGDLGVNCNFACSCVQEPFVMPDLPHAHPHDELLYFFGSDPEHPEQLNAVVEIGIGDDWQKLSFDKTAVLYFRAGLQHAPVYVRKVDRPFYFGHVMQSSNYDKQAEEVLVKAPQGAVKYEDVIKHPVFEKTAATTKLIFRGLDHGANDACIYFYNVLKPAAVTRPEGTENYNQFTTLMGGHPMRIPEFTAEAEISLGAEHENWKVDSTTVVHIPADMVSSAVDFTKVDSPVTMLSIFVPQSVKE